MDIKNAWYWGNLVAFAAVTGLINLLYFLASNDSAYQTKVLIGFHAAAMLLFALLLALLGDLKSDALKKPAVKRTFEILSKSLRNGWGTLLIAALYGIIIFLTYDAYRVRICIPELKDHPDWQVYSGSDGSNYEKPITQILENDQVYRLSKEESIIIIKDTYGFFDPVKVGTSNQGNVWQRLWRYATLSTFDPFLYHSMHRGKEKNPYSDLTHKINISYMSIGQHAPIDFALYEPSRPSKDIIEKGSIPKDILMLAAAAFCTKRHEPLHTNGPNDEKLSSSPPSFTDPLKAVTPSKDENNQKVYGYTVQLHDNNAEYSATLSFNGTDVILRIEQNHIGTLSEYQISRIQSLLKNFVSGEEYSVPETVAQQLQGCNEYDIRRIWDAAGLMDAPCKIDTYAGLFECLGMTPDDARKEWLHLKSDVANGFCCDKAVYHLSGFSMADPKDQPLRADILKAMVDIAVFCHNHDLKRKLIVELDKFLDEGQSDPCYLKTLCDEIMNSETSDLYCFNTEEDKAFNEKALSCLNRLKNLVEADNVTTDGHAKTSYIEGIQKLIRRATALQQNNVDAQLNNIAQNIRNTSVQSR